MGAPDNPPVRAPVGYFFTTRGDRARQTFVIHPRHAGADSLPLRSPASPAQPGPDSIPAILCASGQRKWLGEPSHTMDTIVRH
jgi:hypothetical protein